MLRVPVGRLVFFCLVLLANQCGIAAEILRRFTAEDRTTVSAVAVDAAGNVVLCGTTERVASIPNAVRLGSVGAAFGLDAFVMKLGPRGEVRAAAVFGGADDDEAARIAVDPQGNVVVVGTTASVELPRRWPLTPLQLGLRRTFVARFDATATNLISFALLGGSAQERPTAMTFDGRGRLVLAGQTASPSFPAPAAVPAFGTEIIRSYLAVLTNSAAGPMSVAALTRLGGISTWDAIRSVATDDGGNIYLTGRSTDAGFPVTNALQSLPPVFNQSRAFLTKMNSSGEILYSTWLAGDYWDSGETVLLADAGQKVLVAGSTTSTEFPAETWPTGAVLGAARGFLAELDSDGQRIGRTNFFALGSEIEIVGLAHRPDGSPLLAGNILGRAAPLGTSSPFFVAGSTRAATELEPMRLDRLHAAGDGRFCGMTIDAAGNVIVCGTKGALSGKVVNFVTRYDASEFAQAPVPAIRLTGPGSGSRYAPGSAISFEGLVAGVSATSRISAVTFHAGRRLLGTASNSPSGATFVWNDVPRGVYSVTAAVEVDGRRVVSPPTRVFVDSPANDDFARRTRLRKSAFEVAGNTAGAGIEPGEYLGGGESVWYGWVAPADGAAELTFTTESAASIYWIAGVYTGETLGRLNALVSASPGQPVAFKVQRGVEYLIRVGSYGVIGTQPSYRLTLKTVRPPANDDFAQATALHGDSLSVRSRLRSATLEASEVGVSGTGAGTVWYVWTAPASDRYWVATRGDGSNAPARVSVYEGSRLSRLTAAGGGASVSGLMNGQWFTAELGRTYWIQVSGGGLDEVEWNLTRLPAPVNDHFADRLPIDHGTASVVGTLIGATAEAGEIGSFGLWQPSVWWSWRPASSGLYQLRVRPVEIASPRLGPARVAPSVPAAPNVPPIFNGPVSVYSGNQVDSLQLVSTTSVPWGSGFVLVRAEGGTDYSIAVRASHFYSHFNLDLVPAEVAENDDFEHAESLTGVHLVRTGNFVGATRQTGEPESATSPGFPTAPLASVWYRWTAPTNGEYSISVDSGNVGIYRGASLTELDVIRSMAPRHVFPAAAGGEYHFRVEGWVEYQLRLRPAARPANDDFAGREVLTGLPMSFMPGGFDATSEPGEPIHTWGGPGSGFGFSTASESIWYSWTASANGSCLVASSFPVAVYAGDTLTNLVTAPGGPAPGGFEFQARTGTTYQIALNYGQLFGAPWLAASPVELRSQTQPANDDFARRISVRGEEVEVTGSNIGATLEEGEAASSTQSGRTVWWTWRAPASGHATFKVAPLDPVNSVGLAGVDTFPLVYLGKSVSDLIALPMSSAGRIPVDAGQDYQVAVDSLRSYSSGNFRVQIKHHAGVANDDFANRLTFNGAASGSFLGAGVEPDEPGEFSDPPGTVWWTWTPPETGIYEFRITTATADGYDSGWTVGLDVFTGENLNELARVGAWQKPAVTWPDIGSLRFMATGGVRYALRLWGYADRFEVRMMHESPPANDAFARRIELRGTNLVVVGTNANATVEPGEPGEDDSQRQSLWWTWTAPVRGVARLRLADPNCLETQIYTGANLESLELVAEAWSDEGFSFVAEQGQTYQLAVVSRQCFPNLPEPFTLSLTMHGAPANDRFADRIHLQGASLTLTNLALLGATFEPDDPSFASEGTAWWTWTAPDTGRYTIQSDGSFRLLQGQALNALVGYQGRTRSYSAINVPVTAGTELVILVDGTLELDGPVGLSIRKTTPPINDAFADRIPIAGDQVTGTLDGSSLEAGEAALGDPDGTSIWWSYVPARTGWYDFSLVSNNQLVQNWAPSLFQGTNLVSLQWVYPVYGRSFQPLGRLYWLNEGVSYAVRAGADAGWYHDVELRLREISRPANDDFVDAVRIEGARATLAGSNNLATLELFEPSPSGEVVFGWVPGSVWWRWTPPTSGVYSITRSNSPAHANVDVFTGESVSNLMRVPGTAYGRGFGEYLFRAQGGVTYAIAASTPVNQEGLIRLAVQPANPPANDDFAQRTVLAGSPVSVAADNYDATAEPGDPVADFIGQQTLWWRWTAPRSGRAIVRVSESLRGGIYRGNDLGSLIPVVSPDRSWPAWPAAFAAERGVEYSIGVTTWSGVGRPFTLTLEQPELLLGSPDTSRAWLVETSTNLVDWLPVGTNDVGSAGFGIELDRARPAQFYRNRTPTGR